jgi:hypothetical protein
MVVGPAGPESKDDYADEDHQQITALLEAGEYCEGSAVGLVCQV